MRVFTRRASEEVGVDRPARLVVLRTATDGVQLGLLEGGEDAGKGGPDPGPPADEVVKVIAPFGEVIEIDS